MDNSNEKKTLYKTINILKDSLIINSSIHKDLSPNITISNSKIIIPKENIQKIDNKSQTSSNFIYNTNLINNYQNNIKKGYSYDKVNHLKEYFINDNNIYNDNETNHKKKYNIYINNIQLDKNSLRLISTRFIKNKRMPLIRSNSEFLVVSNINIKKNRSDIVKFRFLQSQKNYYKRISNLKDFNDLKNNLNNFKLESNDFEKNKSIKKRNNALLNSYKEKASLPFIYNSIQNSHYKNNNKKNKIIYINFKNKDRKEDIIQKQKLFRHIEQNFSSNRIKINKLKKEEEKNINKINNNNKSNNNRYINNISSESNKSKENKKLNTIIIFISINPNINISLIRENY